jgi:hypothetical protein
VKIKQLFLGIVVCITIQGVKIPQAQASKECVVYTDSQFKYSFNQLLFTLNQRQAITQFILDNALNDEAILLDLRYLGEHQCQLATILPNHQVRWPTIEDVEFAENLKPEDWFYIENNSKQRYYLLPRGLYTENLPAPVR